jgi:hypothetical protein
MLLLSLFTICSDVCCCCSLCEEHLYVEALGEDEPGRRSSIKRRGEEHLGWRRLFSRMLLDAELPWPEEIVFQDAPGRRAALAGGDRPPGAPGVGGRPSGAPR